MGSNTSNLNLYKPDRTDYVSVITDINNNMDKIDAHAGTVNGRFNNGVLKPENGGTGQTSVVDSMNAFINALPIGNDNPVDNDYIITQYVNGGTTFTGYYRRTLAKLFNYIFGKIIITGVSSGGYVWLNNILPISGKTWIIFGNSNIGGFVGLLKPFSESGYTFGVITASIRTSGYNSPGASMTYSGNNARFTFTAKTSDSQTSTFDCTSVYALRVG